MSPQAPFPRPHRCGRYGAALALALAAGLLAPGAAPARGRFSRTMSSGHLDFQRQVAVARGVGPRAVAGEPDRAVAMARTNRKALLLPHPVDGEVTLGDLAAYHPDLATALEFQFAQAREARRDALPPDLEEVQLELDITELVQLLLPFLGSAEGGPPASLRPIEAPPKRVLLRLSPTLAADHVPSLLPSVRGLGGVEAIPTRGAWLREAYRDPLVRYAGPGAEADEGDWEIPVVATGGLAGATLFLQDSDAERLRRLLAGDEVPRILVVPGTDEGTPPSEEPSPALAALTPPGERELPRKYRQPMPVRIDVGGSSPERGAPSEDPPDFGGMLRNLRARLDEVRPLRAVSAPEPAPPTEAPATPAEAIAAVAPQEGRMPPEVLEALPVDAYADSDDGKLYGAASPAAPAGQPAPRGATWQEFNHPEDPDGTLWESFDSSLDDR